MLKKCIILSFVAIMLCVAQQILAAPSRHVAAHEIRACVAAHINGKYHTTPDSMSSPADTRFNGKHAWVVEAKFKTRNHRMVGKFVVQQRRGHSSGLHVVQEKIRRR